MDNILKLLLGVLGIAGLLAMLAPSSFTPSEPGSVTTEAPPSVEQISTTLPPPEQTAASDNQAYNFKIGEPTIDGKPVVDPSSPSPVIDNNETSSQPTPNSSGDYAAPMQPGYSTPQSDGDAMQIPTP